jgi:hypothetical protein
MNAEPADQNVHVTWTDGGLAVANRQWTDLRLRGLAPALAVDGDEQPAGPPEQPAPAVFRWRFASTPVALTLTLSESPDAGVRLDGTLTNEGGAPVILGQLRLLGGTVRPGQPPFFGRPEQLRLYDGQSAYFGRVRWARSAPGTVRGGEAQGDAGGGGSSQDVWLAYDTAARQAFLAGFLSSNRWQGTIHYEAAADGSESWSVGLDLAGVTIQAGESLALEPVLVLVGPDPWRLLEEYGGRVAELHPVRLPEQSPVTYCSWYPYRLAVTQEAMLANARIAAQRLKPYGLSVMEVDLGWESGNLPSTLTENERFSHGLRWLADRLDELGLKLGVWWAPFSISEFDPVVREQPEIVVADEQGNPYAAESWFWEPKGRVYPLDLTHPGARDWLRAGAASLVGRGMRYLKADFLGIALRPLPHSRRHDPAIIGAGGNEAQRLGLAILKEALTAPGIDGWLMNCGGANLPGPGSGNLLYACQDTGNTGNTGWEFHRNNFHALACHLFKHRRWGILQPSCLCVGPPGTLVEARLRASIAFLSGGEVNIGDDLTTLPEDRWPVLLATVPPYGQAATVIDLFDPLPDGAAEPEETDRRKWCVEEGRVWHLPVKASWDAWDLVGVFDYGTLANQNRTWSKLTRLAIPLARLGLDPAANYWVHEFWSGQTVAAPAVSPPRDGTYSHLGDHRVAVARSQRDELQVTFCGPDVKLLVVRKMRPHPWPLATSFHQSGGCELEQVVWQASTRTLAGVLRRQPGEPGILHIAAAGQSPRQVLLDGQTVPFRITDTGMAVPIICTRETAEWAVVFT